MGQLTKVGGKEEECMETSGNFNSIAKVLKNGMGS